MCVSIVDLGVARDVSLCVSACEDVWRVNLLRNNLYLDAGNVFDVFEKF